MGVEYRAAQGVAPGDGVAGCRMLRPVGSGAAADVWLAVDRSTGERVAVKVYRGGVLPLGERLRVRHPNVLAVRRIVETPPAVVLDLAAGGSLGSLVAARGPLDVGEVATVVVALARALADLHAGGLVHGDLSPANVLFADGGRPLLGDLGDVAVAGVGPVAATAGFAAPEVVAGAVPAGPADVHGLCAVAWFALAGTAPDAAPSRVPLPLLVPAVPVELAEVLAAGLDPQPGGRPGPEDLVAGVLAVAECEPVRLVAGAFPALPRDEASTHRVRRPEAGASGANTLLPDVPPAKPRRRRALRLAAVAVAGAVAGATLGGVGVVDRLTGAAAAGPRPADGVTPGALATVEPSPAPRPESGASTEVAAIVETLVRHREEALRTGDAQALTRVYTPGSAAWVADVALVGEHGPLNVTLEVMAVRAVHGDGDRVTADVRLATRSGPPPSGPAGDGARVEDTEHEVRLTLVHGERWRIDAVTAPGDG
ncbi:MAG: protein kinase [Kineosporiaceae bacterium]